MSEQKGAAQMVVRRINRGQILRKILTGQNDTRVGIASELHLTKTTLTNVANELTAAGILVETDGEAQAGNRLGRKSKHLALSPGAPLLCGIQLTRLRTTVLVGELNGRIVDQSSRRVEPGLTLQQLKATVEELFREVTRRNNRPIAAVSVSSVGPIDCENGILLDPPGYYAESECFNLKEFLETLTDLPLYFSHDATAATIAEKLYGSAKDEETFLFVLLEEGIGLGFYLGGRLYTGPFGQNGEIGHTSIDMNGALCKCGNRGCLELYASAESMRRYAEQFRDFTPDHIIFQQKLGMFDILLLADEGDTLCLELMKMFCGYLARALQNAITLLNVHVIYIGSPLDAYNRSLETMLSTSLNNSLNLAAKSRVKVHKGEFGMESTLYGTLAAVMDQVFKGELDILSSGGNVVFVKKEMNQ